VLRRWSTTSKVFALLAIASGAVAFTTVRGYETRLERLRPALGALVPVVVADAAIPRGTVLDAASLRVDEVPSRFTQPGSVASIDDVVGRTLIAEVAAGEAVPRTWPAAPGVGPVAALVPPGLRAFPLGVSVPEGTALAGDAVDVLATFGGRQPHTETVVSGVEVLDVVGSTPTSGLATTEATSASLVVVVTPEDAERLAYASAFASLSVTVAPVSA
jgi:Flp pilus assembly protein CpaB